MSPSRSGLTIAFLAGVVLGMAVVSSRFAYDAGASGILVAVIRSIIMVVGVGLGLYLKSIPWRLPKALWVPGIVNGALMAFMTYGNIGAVEFISIGLASLLFFTFPILIAITVVALGYEQVQLGKIIAVVIAFAGLSVMLGVSVGAADWRGIIFSLVAATATAINAIIVMRHFRGVNIFVTTFNFSLVSLVVLLLIAMFVAEVRLPATLTGWGGVIGVGVLQTIGTPMYLYAISEIGALRVGMVTNIQPVSAIVVAWLIFGEVLSGLQMAGGLLVLIAIGAMQWLDLRRAEPLRNVQN